MMKDAAKFEPCATLGDSLTLEESQISTAVKFVCRLYGDTTYFAIKWQKKEYL